MRAAAHASEARGRDASADGERVALALRDRVAMRELLEAVAPRVLSAVRSVLGSRAGDVDDVAQESLVAFVGALASFRGQCPVAAFACGIAVRTALRSRRKWARRASLDAARGEDIEAERADPDADLQRAQRLATLRALLQDLPEEQAQALALRCLVGDALPEIAAATGVGVNTLRSRIRLARQALVDRIRGDARLRELFEVPHEP